MRTNNPLTSKQEFILMINWINVRWVNNPIYVQKNIKLYYDDFKFFSPDTNWEAINNLYDKGSKFAPTPSEWRKACMNVYESMGGHYENRDIKGKLEAGEEEERYTLKVYLREHGFESFRHAVYMHLQKQQKQDRLMPYQEDNDYQAPWSEAKEWFRFQIGDENDV
tara:strand:+ start:125 stop:622 length:498 start_codon:yes stop_codon:yes gene_type:complete